MKNNDTFVEETSWIYWKFNKAIDSKTCKKIIALGKGKWENGTVKGLPDKPTRISNIYWATDQWLYDLVFLYMTEANKRAGWNLDISGAESMQVTKYDVGSHYDYHMDGNGTGYYNMPNNKFFHNKTRKLSMSIMLNDGYEGGEFKFQDVPGQISGEGGRGDVIVFPSWQTHKVFPVKKGTRYSLVVWFLGPPLR
jgi:PKHD-type hydroxylase